MGWKAKVGTLLLTAVLLNLPMNAMQAQERSCLARRTKIVGGEPADAAHWPGQAALRLHSEAGLVSSYFCGGAAIGSRWVVTAAHCIPDYISKLTGSVRDSKGKAHQGRLEIVLGAGDLTKVSKEQVFAVERVIVHERYRAAIDKALQIANPGNRRRALDGIAMSVGDDIALLRLASPWSGPVAKLSLSAGGDPANPGTQVRVAGYGTTEHNKDNDMLDRFERADGRGELFAGSPRLLRQRSRPLPRRDARHATAAQSSALAKSVQGWSRAARTVARATAADRW